MPLLEHEELLPIQPEWGGGVGRGQRRVECTGWSKPLVPGNMDVGRPGGHVLVPSIAATPLFEVKCRITQSMPDKLV
jgi:hypothetical protein